MSSLIQVAQLEAVSTAGHAAARTPHFLWIQNMEVNAGQSATFQCSVIGRTSSKEDRLWLQVQCHRQVPHDTYEQEGRLLCGRSWSWSPVKSLTPDLSPFQYSAIPRCSP
ncbi:Receptor-type tyrosine-protein phosphatase mu [Fukomys damarensis]|uniref:Receptor-type tyrosine-protein phosphatase mu n=1 Tax=Fukomys damarensis TaxID=885580 RepID=A0A091EKJ3_FUKDA|nr:Receptor-type tyrosine-protein phosphatase mu [Fukomys damarensis]